MPAPAFLSPSFFAASDFSAASFAASASALALTAATSSAADFFFDFFDWCVVTSSTCVRQLEAPELDVSQPGSIGASRLG